MRVVQAQSGGVLLTGLEIRRYPEGWSDVWCHGIKTFSVPTRELIEVPAVGWQGSDHVTWAVDEAKRLRNGQARRLEDVDE